MVSRIKIRVIIIAIIVALLPSIATRAAIYPLQTAPIIQHNSTYISLNWGEVVSFFQRRKVRRGGRGLFCMITPNQFLTESEREASKEIFSNKPLFSWRISDPKAKPVRIEIFERGKRQVFETLKIKEGETRVIYNGKPLQAGQTYEWKLYALVGGTGGRELESLPVEFELIEVEKRNKITQELTKQEGASADKITLSKVDYLISEGLLSDALWQLYSVRNPSAELRRTIQEIEAHDFCTTNSTKVSTNTL